MAVNKNFALLSLALVLLVPLLFAASDANPVHAQAPAGYWTFDDGSGSQAVDSSGNGRTATLVNGISWISGEIGGAVSADAANHQYVSIPPIDLSGTHAVTVSLWTNRNYSTSGGHALFEATTDYTNSTSGFGLFPDDATCHGIQAALRGDIGLTANCYSPPSSGVWHHLAVVFDKSQTGGNQVLFYVDGVLQSATWSVYASTNTNNFGNDPLYLFSRAGTDEFDSGAIDDLRIYNTALTAAQIQQIYNSTKLVSLAITPAKPKLLIGQQQQFTAVGTYGDGSHQDLTSSVTWTSSSVSVASGNSGVATAIATGNTTIWATAGSIKASVSLNVSSVTLVSLAVTPGNPSIAAGQRQQFTATGTYSDGSHQNLTSTATWTSSTTSVASISSSGAGITFGTPGVATGVAAGSTVIQATSGSISGSTSLTAVTPPKLVSITVTPANPSIAAGQQQQFTATGNYSDGSHQNLTSTARWTSSTPSVATIAAGGMATGVAAGSTVIQATSGSISGSTSLTVTAPTLVSITVTPANPSIAAGQQQQFTATGNYTDGSHQNLTSTATWTSSTPSVATIAAGGMASGVAQGSTTIQATSGSINGSTSLTVTPPTLVSITVTPTNSSIAAGQQQQFTATGNYTDGSHQSLTSTATWTSSATSVATIAAGGLATGVAAGSTVIQATSVSINGSTSLTVTPPTLVSITVTPANPSIAAGQQQQFTATGNYSDGSHQSLTSTATWTSSATSVATIAAGGLATGVAAGSTVIQATSGSISGSTTLQIQHSVALSWTASTSQGIAGYNAYRSTVSGGPYTLLNSSLIASTTYTDQNVQSGITYYYVTTAVDSQDVESAYSNEAAATVP